MLMKQSLTRRDTIHKTAAMKVLLFVAAVLFCAFLTVQTASAESTEIDLAVVASGSCGTSVTWELTDDGTLTISGTGNMTSCTEGSSPWYNYQTQITSVVIRGGVTNVAEYAFAGCSALESVKLPSTVQSINNYSFKDCIALTEVTVASVVNLNNLAFNGCTNLTTLIINGGTWNAYDLGQNYISSCFTDIVIRGGAFSGYGYNSTYYSVFTGCSNLETLILEGGTFNQYAFTNCKVQNLFIGENCVFTANNGNSQFYKCSSLTSVTLADGVTTIVDRMFNSCVSLKDVSFLEGVTTIGPYAFGGCTGLTSVVIPDSVTNIGQSAFGGCTGLTSVAITGSTTIGKQAFSSCTKLNNLDLGSGAIKIQDSAFWNCDGLTSVTIPASTISVGECAFGACDGIQSVTIKGGTVGGRAFSGCSNLRAVIMEGGLVSGGEDEDYGILVPFEGCPLTSLQVTGGTIGYYAFYQQRSLTSISLQNCTLSEERAFRDCTGVTSVELTNCKVTGTYVFDGCTNVRSVTLTDCVVSNSNPFYLLNASYLTSVTVTGGSLGGVGAFQNCKALKTLNLGEGLTQIGAQAFHGCTGLTQVTIPDSVTSVGVNAFYGCTGLKNIDLGSGVESIGANAFNGCTALTGIAVPDSVTSIGEKAFNGCTALKTNSVYIHGAPVIENGAFCEIGSATIYAFGAESLIADFNYDSTSAVKGIYAIVFMDTDGTIISKEFYLSLAPVVVPENPAKEPDETFTYKFAGWSPDVSAYASGNATYTAQYTPVAKEKYTITFYDEDGKVISAKTYYEGDEITFPADPVKPEDNAATYTFAGWTPEPTLICDGEAVYTATYAAEYKNLTVTFLDWDGSVISEKTDYKYGDQVVKPANPTRAADDEYTYSFTGWDFAVDRYVTDNVVYTAEYSRTPRSYTVAFYDYNGNTVYLAKYQYGESVYAPGTAPAPSIDDGNGGKSYGYKFSHWSTDGSNYTGGAEDFNPVCQGNANYYAQYKIAEVNYIVTFKNWDGSVISTKTDYHYGDAVTAPDTPTREADSTYQYTFTGWDKEITAVTGNVTYTAQYESAYRQYSVKFLDHDGTVLSEKTDYKYGDSVVVPVSPTRDATVEITYSFAGWSPDIQATVMGDAVYTATYAENATEHTVTFKDHDDTVISSEVYGYGATVVVPADPEREEDDTATYVFVDWSPDVAETVSGSAIYIAQYQPTYKEYTVKFLDEDGTEISSAVYHWGDTIVVPADPTKAQEGETVYSFAGWDQEISATCNGSVTYTATYQEGEVAYTVTFLDWDGTPLLIRSDYKRGDAVELPSDPVRADDANYTYTFACWTPTVAETVTGNATYTATYTMTSTSEFEVVFVDYDGTVISTATYQQGDTVVFPSDPVRPDDVDNNMSFTFAGWNYVVGADGDMTYIATYSMSYIGTYAAYTVIFEDYDGTELEVATYEQPEAVAAPVAPVRESDDVYDYTFSGWVYEGGNTVAPMAAFAMRTLDAEGGSDSATSFVAVYAANYLETYRKYAVTFQDYDGTVLFSKTDYHWNDTVEVPADPTRASDGSNTYTFAGWDKVVSAVDGNATYVATYTATPIQQESGSTGGTTGGNWWDDNYDDTDTEETPTDEPTEEEPPAEDEETKDDPTEEESKETGEQENTEEPPVKENPAESEPENNIGEVVEQPTGDTVNNGAGKNNTPVIESKPSDGNTVEEAPAEAEDVTITYYDYFGVAHTHVIKDGETKLVPSDVPERVMENGRTYEFKKWEISLDENGNRVYKPIYALAEAEEAPLHNTPVTIDPGAFGAEEDSDGEGDLFAVQIVAIVAASIVAVVGISAGVSFLHRRRN